MMPFLPDKQCLVPKERAWDTEPQQLRSSRPFYPASRAARAASRHVATQTKSWSPRSVSYRWFIRTSCSGRSWALLVQVKNSVFPFHCIKSAKVHSCLFGFSGYIHKQPEDTFRFHICAFGFLDLDCKVQ